MLEYTNLISQYQDISIKLMKTEEIKIDFTQFSIHKNDEKIKILCIEGKQVIHACFKDTCNKSAFLCIDETCKCKQDHKSCILQSTLVCIKSILQHKSQPLKQISLTIQSQIQKAIDQLSRLQEKLKKDIDNSFTYVGFTQTQNLVMKALRTGQVKQIKGKHIYQMQQGLKKQNKTQYQVVEAKINKGWNKYKEDFRVFIQSINNTIFNENKIVLLKNSSIIKTYDDVLKMIKFFNKKIQKTQLLYRATRDTFKVDKFHQKCNNISNTLTIIQTNSQKIFGGYTSCTWNSSNTYSADNNRESFIFQFDHNDKFTLKNDRTANAIYNGASWGPTFGLGQHDIAILDNSNINNNSYANIGHNYQNASYICGDFASQARFSGFKQFVVKDFEIWKVTFA